MSKPQQTPEPDFGKVETRFCPTCGSPAVTYQELIGGNAKCRVCSYEGKTTDFPVQFQFVSSAGTIEDLNERFLKDIKGVVQHHMSTPLLRLLQRYGFLWWEANEWGSENSQEGMWRRRVATIYLTNAVRALFESFTHTREVVEVLRVKHEEYRNRGN